MGGKHSRGYRTNYSSDEDEMPRALRRDTQRNNSKRTRKKKNKGLRIFGKIVLVLIIILIILLGAVFAFLNSKLGKMKKVDINEAELGISDQVNCNIWSR